MPDGARHGRRFLVTDKLQVNLLMCVLSNFLTLDLTFIFLPVQSLFDFIDAGGWVKPMTYKLASIPIYLLPYA